MPRRLQALLWARAGAQKEGGTHVARTLVLEMSLVKAVFSVKLIFLIFF